MQREDWRKKLSTISSALARKIHRTQVGNSEAQDITSEDYKASSSDVGAIQQRDQTSGNEANWFERDIFLQVRDLIKYRLISLTSKLQSLASNEKQTLHILGRSVGR